MIYKLIWLHFISDFVLQNNYMARGKSKSNLILLLHVFVYSIPFLLIGWKFAILNGVFHFIVDWVTSRGTSYLWKRQEIHWFFVVIGLDQACHFTIMLLLINFLK